MFWRRVKQLIWLLILCALLFLTYRLMTASSVAMEPSEQIVLMPDDEFAENPVLFRSADGSLVAPVVDVTNCQQIIATIRRPESMYWECTTTLRSSAGNVRRTGRYYKRGSSYVAELRSTGGALETRVVSDGARAKISSGGGDTRTVSSIAQYTPEAVMGMADLDYFLALPAANILEARLEIFDGKDCLYVKVSFPELRMTEQYYISLFYGIPLSVESYLSDTLIYSAETVAVNDEEQPASLFSL